jgi:multidrug efflux pump subunit AcrA (membrane-fusion protein)
VTPAEIAFVAVNETVSVTPYRQAALWELGRGLVAVSGVPSPANDAPFTLWLVRICRHLSSAGPIQPTDLPPADRPEWAEWLPAHGYWLPWPKSRAGLLLAREEPWSEADGAVLSELAHAYDHAMAALQRPSMWTEWKSRARLRGRVTLMAILAFAALAALPVPLTVLAPAEVVAADPAIIRAPLDGVVRQLNVRPNQRVVEGQLLFELDDTTLKGKIEVAEKTLAAAEAELRQLSQQAVFDPTAKPKLAATLGRREQQSAELRYLRDLVDRAHVKAPAAGIAVLDDASEWIGRPVAVGEKVLALAEEHDTEIEAWLAPTDAIELPEGASVTLFLNVAPLSPVSARLVYVAYEAAPRPDGSAAYRVRARIVEGDKPRLGLRGTARLAGARVPLIYWLLRRPIGMVRAAVGL